MRFFFNIHKKMATPRMNTDEALAYYEELEDTELSELSSDEESDIDRCMAGFGDDFDQDISGEEQYTNRLIPGGIGEDFNQDQCHLPSSR